MIGQKKKKKKGHLRSEIGGGGFELQSQGTPGSCSIADFTVSGGQCPIMSLVCIGMCVHVRCDICVCVIFSSRLPQCLLEADFTESVS